MPVPSSTHRVSRASSSSPHGLARPVPSAALSKRSQIFLSCLLSTLTCTRVSRPFSSDLMNARYAHPEELHVQLFSTAPLELKGSSIWRYARFDDSSHRRHFLCGSSKNQKSCSSCGPCASTAMIESEPRCAVSPEPRTAGIDAPSLSALLLATSPLLARAPPSTCESASPLELLPPSGAHAGSSVNLDFVSRDWLLPFFQKT